MGSLRSESAGRMRRAAALVPSTSNSVKLVCDFVNAEIARVRGRIIAIALACILAAILVPLITPLVDGRILLLLGGGSFAFFAARLRHELRSTWRNIAVKRLVAALGRRLTYQRASALTRDQFVATELFPDTGAQFESLHQVSGGAPRAGFSLHQVRASGRGRGTFAFRGVVVRVDAPQVFTGHTIVVPDREGILAGPGASRARDVVMLRNPAFEHAFSTYSTDYAEARSALSPGLMQLLLEATQSIAEDIRLALQGRAVYVAVPCDALFPDVALFSPSLTPDVAAPLVRITDFAERIVALLGTASRAEAAPRR